MCSNAVCALAEVIGQEAFDEMAGGLGQGATGGSVTLAHQGAAPLSYLALERHGSIGTLLHSAWRGLLQCCNTTSQSIASTLQHPCMQL